MGHKYFADYYRNACLATIFLSFVFWSAGSSYFAVGLLKIAALFFGIAMIVRLHEHRPAKTKVSERDQHERIE